MICWQWPMDNNDWERRMEIRFLRRIDLYEAGASREMEIREELRIRSDCELIEEKLEVL